MSDFETTPAPNYTQIGTTTVDLDGMRAEIARLKAREAEMREAIVGSLITLRSSMGNTNKVMYTEAKLSRALLARESAEPAEERDAESIRLEIMAHGVPAGLLEGYVEARMKGEGK
jgi:hypothetical protein